MAWESLAWFSVPISSGFQCFPSRLQGPPWSMSHSHECFHAESSQASKPMSHCHVCFHAESSQASKPRNRLHGKNSQEIIVLVILKTRIGQTKFSKSRWGPALPYLTRKISGKHLSALQEIVGWCRRWYVVSQKLHSPVILEAGPFELQRLGLCVYHDCIYFLQHFWFFLQATCFSPNTNPQNFLQFFYSSDSERALYSANTLLDQSVSGFVRVNVLTTFEIDAVRLMNFSTEFLIEGLYGSG